MKDTQEKTPMTEIDKTFLELEALNKLFQAFGKNESNKVIEMSDAIRAYKEAVSLIQYNIKEFPDQISNKQSITSKLNNYIKIQSRLEEIKQDPALTLLQNILHKLGAIDQNNLPKYEIKQLGKLKDALSANLTDSQYREKISHYLDKSPTLSSLIDSTKIDSNDTDSTEIDSARIDSTQMKSIDFSKARTETFVPVLQLINKPQLVNNQPLVLVVGEFKKRLDKIQENPKENNSNTNTFKGGPK